MGRMIILDLFTDVFPVWKRRDLARPTPIEGRPWIWNMLHSFGGNTGMYGRMQVVGRDPVVARSESPDMVGIGITTEGIEQNPIVYELMAEMRWAHEPADPAMWAREWAARRLGPDADSRMLRKAQEAWTLLAETVYSCKTTQMGQVKSMIESRPRLDLHTGYIRNSDFMPIRRHYSDAVLVKAWYKLLDAHGLGGEPKGGLNTDEPPVLAGNELEAASAATTSASRYDLVDVTRQVLSDLFARLFVQLSGYLQQRGVAHQGYTAGAPLPTGSIKTNADAEMRMKMLEGLILDIDRLLGTQEWLLLGRWIAMARAWGDSEDQKAHFEFNARNVLTLWGPNGEIADYASKQWNGLLADFYLPRWQLFFAAVREALETGSALDELQFRAALLAQEKAWQKKTTPNFPAGPVGDTVAIVANLRARYGLIIRSTAHEDVYAVPDAGNVVHAPGADVLSDEDGGEVRAGVARPDGR